MTTIVKLAPAQKRTTPRLVKPRGKHKSYGIMWAELPVGATKWVTRRRSTNRTDPEGAERVFRDFMQGFVRPNPARVERSLGELAELYLVEHCRAKSARLERSQRFALRAPVLALGEREPDELTPQVWTAYTEARRRGEYAGAKSGPVSDPTIRREIGAAVAAMNWAATKRGLIDRNSIPPAPLPDPGQPRETWLDEEQLEAVLADADGAPGDVRAMTYLLAFTGARFGAVFDLDWSRVWWRPEPGKLDFRVPGAHTGRKRRAVVPMARRLRPILDRWHMDQGRPETGPVVSKASRDGFYRRFRRYIEPTPHTFRHTFITLRLRAGRDPWKIAGLVNEDVQTLLRVYGHHRPDHLTDTLDL